MTASLFIVSTVSGKFLAVTKTGSYTATADRAKATEFTSELAAQAAKVEWAQRLDTATAKAHARMVKAANGRTVAPLSGISIVGSFSVESV